MRAQAAGWVNLHTLDTFVRHAGGVSFGDSKSEREMLAMQTIRRLHPQYEGDVHAFVQHDPARSARLMLDLARLTCPDRVLILNVMHNRAGGSLRHLDDMARAFAGQAQFLTLTPLEGGLCLRLQGRHEAFSVQWPSLQPAQWESLLHTLRQLGVAHVHYHHLMGHSPQVAGLHQLLGVSHDFTAHDYYSYCPQITLTDANDRYCGEKGLSQCQQCVKQRPAPGGQDIIDWRAQSLSLLNTAHHVFAPSQDTARRMQQFAPLARVVFAPHQQVQAQTLHSEPSPTPRQLNPLKVVVLGALSKIKGADILDEVAMLAKKQQAPIEFHLLGYGYRALRTRPGSHLTVHGAYQEAELPDLLRWLDADLAWFPAQCPETYSYTLSACLQAGLPIMGSDLGALAERLGQRRWAWLVDWQSSPQQWLHHLLAARDALATGTVATPNAQSPSKSAAPFDYASHYLVPPGHACPPGDLAALGSSLLALNRRTAAGASSTGLKALYWLRSHPLLSRLAKAIPGHVQRRVKSYLLNKPAAKS